MTQENDNSKNISESNLVDTLFGPEEQITVKQKLEKILEEELPHYLFAKQDSSKQSSLPLIKVVYGRPKVIYQKNISALVPFLNELDLYEKQWGFVDKNITREVWCQKANEVLASILNKFVRLSQEHLLLEPKSIFAYFYCMAEDETLYIYDKHTKEEIASVEMPRLKNGVCVTDKVSQRNTGVYDNICVFATTLGRNVADRTKGLVQSQPDPDFKYFQGFVVEMLNAMANYTADCIFKKSCCVGDIYSLKSLKKGAVKNQHTLLKVLKSSIIDVTCNRNFLMMPEYSSLSLVLPR